MKTSVYASFFLLFLLFQLASCQKKEGRLVKRKVEIRKEQGKFVLYKDGAPFVVKGAGGDTHFDRLRMAGGNTIRVWDTNNLGVVLDSALQNNLAVIVGLPVYDNKYVSYYEDPAKVNSQFKELRALVNRYKSHPAVLMWCLGNELTFESWISHNNFYGAFNELTDMIHADDPDHPVTTALLNFQKAQIFNLSMRCDLDLLSFNVYGGLASLRHDLDRFSLVWDGPYLLSEWGIDGAWKGRNQNAWGAYMEDTSNKKAEIYRQRYITDVPVEDPRYLGSCVFFWGNKQECTHTWFSLFDEFGARSEAVDVMQQLWTGTKSGKKFPQIRYMLVNKKGAADNIMLSAGSVLNARVLLSRKLEDFKSITWEVYPEDWYRKNGKSNHKKLTPLESQTYPDQKTSVTLRAPVKEGPYRIFATIRDKDGGFASCNTPFYVVGAEL